MKSMFLTSKSKSQRGEWVRGRWILTWRARRSEIGELRGKGDIGMEIVEFGGWWRMERGCFMLGWEGDGGLGL